MFVNPKENLNAESKPLNSNSKSNALISDDSRYTELRGNDLESGYDLSGDTRVNYVRGQTKENSKSSDAEVFSYHLMREDERRNSGRPRFGSNNNNVRLASLRSLPPVANPSAVVDDRRAPIAGGHINPYHRSHRIYEPVAGPIRQPYF